MTHSVLSKGIWPVERVILAYIAFTFLLMFCWWNSLVDPLLLFLTRGKALLLMAQAASHTLCFTCFMVLVAMRMHGVN